MIKRMTVAWARAATKPRMKPPAQTQNAGLVNSGGSTLRLATNGNRMVLMRQHRNGSTQLKRFGNCGMPSRSQQKMLTRSTTRIPAGEARMTFRGSRSVSMSERFTPAKAARQSLFMHEYRDEKADDRAYRAGDEDYP